VTEKTSKPIIISRQIGLIISFIFSVIIIYSIAISLFDEANSRFGAITFGFAGVLFSSPLAGKAWSTPSKIAFWLIDLVLIVGFIFSGWWFYAVKDDLWTGFYTVSPMNVTAGIIGIVILLEMCRRAWGWSLVILAIVFFAFGFSGPWLPGVLTHFGVDLPNFMQIVWYSFDGVFGRITGLVSNTVLIFLIFGAMLERTGAGESLIHISTVLTARIRGGAAHAAIVASAVFGMMSGSVAANIAGTGVFTIPMIKRQGFSANFAAAVETAASSGGQLTPPIMAAAVFVMADLVGEPYLLIIAAASLPALFKYLSLFAQVYTEAIRLDLKPMDKNKIPKLTRHDWINSLLVFLPIATLMIAFLLGFSPPMAGLVGVATTIITGFVLNPDFRRKPKLILEGLAAGGLSSAQIMIAVGVIGMVMAVINESGVAIRFATSIAAYGDDQLIYALILSMIGALILGMGLPTLAAYLIIAIMIAPAIIKAGVLPIAAHMFVLYYAVYSSIVPPIAYGCFIAAPIAGGHPFITSFIALRLSIVGLMVPYVFVYSPSLLLVAGEYSHTALIFI
jgi:TRAP transporter 4TM/12TM fusion protein